MVTIAQYCYCVYSDRELMKPTHDVLEEVAELVRNPVQKEENDEKADV